MILFWFYLIEKDHKNKIWSLETGAILWPRVPSVYSWNLKTIYGLPLRKQAYSNILENLPAKYENFQIKILIFFLCLLKNIDCGYSLEPPRRGGSNEYPQSMFWAEIWKIMYTPVNPSFTIYKSGV